MNTEILSKILQGNCEYWVIERRVDPLRDGKPDYSIWFIGIGSDTQCGIDRNEIKLIDLERLRKKNFQNIPLYPYYPPFQEGIQLLWDAVDGFPVDKGNINHFLAAAIHVGTNKLMDYKRLLETNDVKSGA